jgi:hypothetical protein
MPLLRSFGFGWRGGCNDVAPTALDAARLIFWVKKEAAWQNLLKVI